MEVPEIIATIVSGLVPLVLGFWWMRTNGTKKRTEEARSSTPLLAHRVALEKEREEAAKALDALEEESKALSRVSAISDPDARSEELARLSNRRKTRN